MLLSDKCPIGPCERLRLPSPLQAQVDQLRYQFPVADAGCIPQLGKHRDLGEAGDRVDLIHVKSIVCRIKEQIDTSHAHAIYRAKRRDRQLL